MSVVNQFGYDDKPGYFGAKTILKKLNKAANDDSDAEVLTIDLGEKTEAIATFNKLSIGLYEYTGTAN